VVLHASSERYEDIYRHESGRGHTLLSFVTYSDHREVENSFEFSGSPC
jgi:hypothetical protein